MTWIRSPRRDRAAWLQAAGRAPAGAGAPAGGGPGALAGLLPATCSACACCAALRRDAALGAHGDDPPLVELRESRAPRRCRAGAGSGCTTSPSCCPTARRWAASWRTWRSRRARRRVGPPGERGALPADPDGLGIEVYADRPRAPGASTDRQLVMATDPLDLPDLVRAAGGEPWTGMPAGHDDRPRAPARRRPGGGGGVLPPGARARQGGRGATRARCSSPPAATTITWAEHLGRPAPPPRRRRRAPARMGDHRPHPG